MIPVQQNRYLWVQLVGLAAVPLLLDICLAGLASSRIAFDFPSAFGLQFWAIAAIGILPPLAMQWLRPFYPFSLPPLALKPSSLTDNQRRNLTLLGSWQIKALAILGGGLSLWLLVQLYGRSALITAVMTPTVGIISTAVTFFFACLFLQISISSLRLLLVGPQTLKRVTPYEAFDIAANFSILGLRVNTILPVPNVQPASTLDDPPEEPQEEPPEDSIPLPEDADESPIAAAQPVPATQPGMSAPSETTAQPESIEQPQANLEEVQAVEEVQAKDVEESTLTAGATVNPTDDLSDDETVDEQENTDSNSNNNASSDIDEAIENDDFESLS